MVKLIVQAHLLNGSNVVFLEKNHLKNADALDFSEVDIYLTEQEITDLYSRMKELEQR